MLMVLALWAFLPIIFGYGIYKYCTSPWSVKELFASADEKAFLITLREVLTNSKDWDGYSSGSTITCKSNKRIKIERRVSGGWDECHIEYQLYVFGGLDDDYRQTFEEDHIGWKTVHRFWVDVIDRLKDEERVKKEAKEKRELAKINGGLKALEFEKTVNGFKEKVKNQ